VIKNRRIRVGLEVDGKTSFYEGLKIGAEGVKYASPYKNEAGISIAGLSQDTRSAVLTNFSSKKPMRVILEVGREKESLFTLFIGDVVNVSTGEAPDFTLEIKAQTRRNGATKIVTMDGAESVSLKGIAEKCAANLGIKLKFQAKERKVAGYSYTGDAAAQVYDIARVGGVVTYVDDDTLFVLDADDFAKSRRRILNEKSGMIGLPRPTDGGVEVTFLIDGTAILGGQLTIESKLDPTLSGDYIVKQLSFNAQTHSDEFFYIAKCAKMGGMASGAQKEITPITSKTKGDQYGGYL
jgi:hypothetical protein